MDSELRAGFRDLAAAGGAAGPCPDAEALVRVADGIELPAGEHQSLSVHLTRCLACAIEAEALERAGRRAGRRPVTTPPARTTIAALRALMSLVMPLRLSFVTRGAAVDATGASYTRGMEAYAAGRYAVAARHLEQARRAGERAVDLGFFLGVCQLHAGRTADAVESLADAVQARPRHADSHWYLAQASLGAGDGERALHHLLRAARLPGSHRGAARAAAKAVRALLGHT